MPVSDPNASRSEAARLIGALVMVVTLAGCGDGGDGPSTAPEAQSSAPAARELDLAPAVAFGAPSAPAPEQARVDEVLAALDSADLDGGTADLAECPLGDDITLFSSLPRDWSDPDPVTGRVDPYNSFEDDGPGGVCSAGYAMLFFERTPPSMSEEDVMSGLTQPGWVVSEPVDHFGGRAYTYCYENATTGNPACGATWFDDELAVSGTLHGPDSTAEVAAAWFSHAVPAMLGPSLDSPTDALPAGTAARFGATFDVEDEDGYTASIAVQGTLSPFTEEVADSLPGEFAAVTSATVGGTATNTTAGRNAPVPAIGLVALYARDSAACRLNGVSKSGDSWQDTSFCAIGIGSLQEVELAPDGAGDLGGGEVPISVGGLAEGSDALAQLNAPVAVYARFGSDPIYTARANVTSASGCEASGAAHTMWYVPMDGWPDPICG